MRRALPFGHPDRPPSRRGVRPPRKHTYSRADFAAALGCLAGNLGAELRRAGVGEPIPLGWFAQRLAHRWFEVSRPLDAKQSAEALGVSELAWSERWPEFGVHYCGFAECACFVTSPGLCAKHAGRKPQTLVVDGYYCLNVEGRVMPFHRYVCPVERGQGVFHRDGNRLNNRVGNLEIRPISSFVVGSSL